MQGEGRQVRAAEAAESFAEAVLEFYKPDSNHPATPEPSRRDTMDTAQTFLDAVAVSIRTKTRGETGVDEVVAADPYRQYLATYLAQYVERYAAGQGSGHGEPLEPPPSLDPQEPTGPGERLRRPTGFDVAERHQTFPHMDIELGGRGEHV